MDLLNLGKEPVSSSSPTGVDVRYEPVFEELQQEIDKLSNPAASGGADWKKVDKLASELLANKGKDLLVASYLAVAQIHLNQVEGFAVGLHIYRDLLEQFWEDLYPTKKRMRGRIAAVEWWLERSDAAFPSLKVTPLPAERIEEFRQDLSRIDELLRGYLEEPPLLRPIEKFIESIPLRAEKKPEPDGVTPQAKAAAPAAAAASSTVDEIASPADAERVLQGALDSIRRAGDYLQREGLSNPLAFRLRRLASWSIVDAIPPATDGRTIVPPPDPNVRNMLTELQDKGDWQALVEASEEKVSECIFWLDLNRFVAEGLNGLGGPYQDARNAVSQETAFFLLRLPGIENLSFSDGSPFADADTRQWLKSIGLGAGAASGQPGPSAGTGEGDRMAEAVRKAEELAKKKLPEAVSSVQQELRSSFAKRDQLLWRMALSRILVKAKKVELALPHLEAILCDIDLYRLEEWDPDLAVKGLRMVWSGFSTQSDESSRERVADVLNRLAKLDPAGVLSL